MLSDQRPSGTRGKKIMDEYTTAKEEDNEGEADLNLSEAKAKHNTSCIHSHLSVCHRR